MNAKKLVYYSIHPINTIFKIGSYSFLKCLNDRMFIKIAYYVNMKLLLNIDNPKTYNEKIQWLKLYDRNPFYKEIVDKYQVKKYVSNIIGKDYLILQQLLEILYLLYFYLFLNLFYLQNLHIYYFYL